MNTPHLFLRTVSVVIIMLAGFTLARAQASRTWVSGVGDDANPCSRTAPCKTFAGAISKTAAGGEINPLDPGGYGGVVITKAMTINAAGTLGSILASGTNGIVVNAGANDVVTLRNLEINGLGNSPAGIKYMAGRQLTVEHCTIQGVATGIDVNLGASGTLNVRDVSISQATPNGGPPASGVGIRLNTAAGFFVTAMIDNLHTADLISYGVQAQRGAFVAVSNSRFDRTGAAALAAENNSNINAENVIMAFGQNGVHVASPTATIRLSNCGIFSNSLDISNPGGGAVISFGNNRMAGNAATGLLTSTPLEK